MVTVTEQARIKIEELKAKEGKDGTQGIRVGVQPRGSGRRVDNHPPAGMGRPAGGETTPGRNGGIRARPW